MGKVRRYEVTAAGDFAAVLAVLTDHLGLRLTRSESFERSWLDTTDGALAADGSTLEHRRPIDSGNDASPSLLWSTEDRVLAQDGCVPVSPPTGADQLPSTSAFGRLGRLIGTEALVVGPTVISRLATLAALDDEEKTTARVILDESETTDEVRLGMMLEVVALRGYESEAKRLDRAMQRAVALTPSETSMSRRAAEGRPARSSDSATPSLTPSLTPTMTAAAAWRVVLGRLTDSMTQSFSGVMSGSDPEDLHDFRVAVRRIRTLLQDGSDIIEPVQRDRFRNDYRWLGDVTTPTRDADVQLIDFPELASTTDALTHHRDACHAEMVVQLRSLRRAEFGTAWLALLDDDEAWSGTGERSEDPVLPIVLQRIGRAHRQLIKSGQRINRQSPPIALHELRKEGKRLRYLLECFEPILDEAALTTILRPLRELQSVLGEFQDTEVQANSLREVVGRAPSDEGAAEDPVGDAETRAALDRALVQLAARGVEARAAFSKAFKSLDHRSVERALLRLGSTQEQESRKTRGKRRKKK